MHAARQQQPTHFSADRVSGDDRSDGFRARKPAGRPSDSGPAPQLRETHAHSARRRRRRCYRSARRQNAAQHSNREPACAGRGKKPRARLCNNRVRNRLSAGGSWIQTSGSARDSVWFSWSRCLSSISSRRPDRHRRVTEFGSNRCHHFDCRSAPVQTPDPLSHKVGAPEGKSNPSPFMWSP
jgi:hypothetical protein